DLNHAHSATAITSGTFADARIPNLNASKITAGVLAAARIPALPISQITNLQTTLDGKVALTGNQTISGTKTFAGYVHTSGDSGWYNSTYQGGFYMKDTDWIRAYGNKGIYTSGEIRGGTLRS